jgi:multiple sugar transport system substrate-binding protein
MIKKSTLLLTVIVLTLGCMASAWGQTKTAYGMKAGKPYDGKKIAILLHPSKQNEAIKVRTAKFTELTGIKVEYDVTPYGSLLEKITSEAVAGSGVHDAFISNSPWGPSLQQYLQPLDNYVKESGIDMKRYPKVYVDACTYDGKLIGMPYRGHPQLLFYRKDIFKKLGLNPPKTWAELETVAKTIKEKTNLYGISPYYAKGTSMQNLFVWSTYLWSNKADLFDSNWKPIFNNAAGIEATQRYMDPLLKMKIAPPGSVTYNEYEGVQSVAQGEFAMVIVWWWVYSVLNDPKVAKPEVAGNIGAVPAPGWEGKDKGTNALLMPLSMFASSKNKEAAWEWMKWATSPELEKERVLDKSDPKTTEIVMVHYSTLRDTEVNKAWDGLPAEGAKSLEVAKIFPLIPEWPEISSVLEIAINDIATGKPTKEILDRAAKEVEGITKRSRVK